MASLVRLELGGPGRAYRYAVWQTRTGRRRKRSLGHVDKVGVREARRLCAKIQAELAIKGEVEGGRCPTLNTWLKRFVAQRDLKRSTIAEYETTVRKLVDYFGDARLDKINEEHAADFRGILSKGAASESTVRKHVRNCKSLFKEATRQKLISANPFDEQAGSPLEIDKEWRYISTEEATQLMAACPSPKWRVLFALTRFAGLRLHEALHVAWSDIDFDERSLTVRNRARKRTTKDRKRVVPIMPELHRELLDRYAEAEAGELRVVGFSPGYFSGGGKARSGRTVVKKIYRAAKVLKGDPFHDLRRSLETDWLKEYPVLDVCKMLGNSPEVAWRHYHQLIGHTAGLITGRTEDERDRKIRELRAELDRLKDEASEQT